MWLNTLGGALHPQPHPTSSPGTILVPPHYDYCVAPTKAIDIVPPPMGSSVAKSPVNGWKSQVRRQKEVDIEVKGACGGFCTTMEQVGRHCVVISGVAWWQWGGVLKFCWTLSLPPAQVWQAGRWGEGSGEEGKKERMPTRSWMVVAIAGSSSRMIIRLWLWMMAWMSDGEEWESCGQKEGEESWVLQRWNWWWMNDQWWYFYVEFERVCENWKWVFEVMVKLSFSIAECVYGLSLFVCSWKLDDASFQKMCLEPKWSLKVWRHC